MKTNCKGFGLIEIMISMAIMSIVLVGSMSLIELTGRQSLTADVKNSVTALTASVTGVALNQVSCTTAITWINQPYVPTVLVFQMPNGETLSVGQTLPTYNLQVESLELTHPILVATGYDGTKVYYGNLMLGLSTKQDVLGTKVFTPRIIGSIYITVNPTNNIVQCGVNLPTLPAVPIPPPAPAVESKEPSKEVAKTCQDLGGQMNGVACVFPPSHKDNDDSPCNNN